MVEEIWAMKYIELECYNWMFSEYDYTLNPFPQVPKVGGRVIFSVIAEIILIWKK